MRKSKRNKQNKAQQEPVNIKALSTSEVMTIPFERIEDDDYYAPETVQMPETLDESIVQYGIAVKLLCYNDSMTTIGEFYMGEEFLEASTGAGRKEIEAIENEAIDAFEDLRKQFITLDKEYDIKTYDGEILLRLGCILFIELVCMNYDAELVSLHGLENCSPIDIDSIDDFYAINFASKDFLIPEENGFDMSANPFMEAARIAKDLIKQHPLVNEVVFQ